MTDSTKEIENQAKDHDAPNVKLAAAAAYFGITFFIPLITHPNNKFATFHANQGLLLLLLSMLVSALGEMIGLLGVLVIPFLGLVIFVLFVMGLVNALNGETKRLPLIGGFDLIKPSK